MKKALLYLLLTFISVQTFAQKKKKKEHIITLSTTFGNMKLRLFDETPKHKENFLKLASQKYYDSLLFHRVISGFMIQGGDPTSKNAPAGGALGNGDIGYRIPAEFAPNLFHKKGALAAARTNNPEKASSGCQFYIVQGKPYADAASFDVQAARSGAKYNDEQKKTYQTLGGTPHLDQNYTVFGEVIEGLAVVDSIAKQATDPRNRPIKDIRMKMTVEEIRLRKLRKMYPDIWQKEPKQ